MQKSTIDLKALSILELESLIIEASNEIEQRKLDESKNIRNQIEVMLEQAGLSLSDVFREKNPRKGVPSPIKYRNPANPTQKWSGRGKLPIWMRDAIANGAKREDFEI